MARPAGYTIDVPITISVSVRGATEAEAIAIARTFADRLEPTTDYVTGYNSGAGLGNAKITEVGFESPREDSCSVLEELEADDEDYD